MSVCLRLTALWAAMLCMLAGAGLAREPAAHTHTAEETLPAAQLPREADWAPFRLLEGQARYLPATIRALGQAAELRPAGLFALGMLGLPEGVAPARKYLRDADRQTRLHAAVALTLLYQADGLPGATVALREGPEWLRYYALLGLWRVNSTRSRQALRDSRPYLSGFLRATADQALSAGPKFRCPGKRVSLPDDRVLPYEVWDAVSAAFVVESDLWWHEGNYDQCIRTQRTALVYDPEYVDLYTNIAWLQWSMGRHGEAVRTYRDCIAANPQSWVAHQALGEYYWRHGQKLVAVKYLQAAADHGSPAVPRRALGHAYRDLGQGDRARAVWQDILKLDPNDPIALRELQRTR